MAEASDLRRKQLTLECGILDNEAKMNRKRKLVERKNLFEEGNRDCEDLKAALETIGERTEFMKVICLSNVSCLDLYSFFWE